MKAKKITLILSSMIIIAILILTACDKRVIELPDYIIQSISAFPDSLYADNDNTTKSEIRATVVDNAGNPVVGETVTFKTLEDSLANINATAVTQSNGVAKVEFLDRGIVGVSTVQATIANSSETVSVRIIEKPAALKKYIAQLFAVPDSIYADNNDATYSEIKAYIVDENGFSVIGDTVYFQTDSDLGSIVSSATTDQNGIATANFHDHGELGTATIQASIPDTIVTVNVRIIETPSCHIDLLLAIPDSIYADDNDATYSEIDAYIVDDNGYPVESYSVSFQTDLGSVDGTAVTDITGIATAKYYDNGNLGIATIQASIEDTTTSIQVRVIELPSYHIEWIDADPDTIYADNNITYSEISVLVKDEQNFAVPGES
ncbi:MAG TPA: hypothetical protein ENL20_06975, partial [Candidatus Cloacimonetes bacterium]|nr:hypothetical protein [Candidatus Cloacimonadota bacterium]